MVAPYLHVRGFAALGDPGLRSPGRRTDTLVGDSDAGSHADPGPNHSQRRVTVARERIWLAAKSNDELAVGPSYCQYELLQAHPEETHLGLYRGIKRMDEHEILESLGGGRYRVLFNNLNSFTSSGERADEFGDYILLAEVPLPKVFFFNRLLPGMLKGEDEFVVVGGV